METLRTNAEIKEVALNAGAKALQKKRTQELVEALERLKQPDVMSPGMSAKPAFDVLLQAKRIYRSLGYAHTAKTLQIAMDACRVAE